MLCVCLVCEQTQILYHYFLHGRCIFCSRIWTGFTRDVSQGHIRLCIVHSFCSSAPISMNPIPKDRSIALVFQMPRFDRAPRSYEKVSITVNILIFFKKVQKTSIFRLPCTVFAVFVQKLRIQIHRKVHILLFFKCPGLIGFRESL